MARIPSAAGGFIAALAIVAGFGCQWSGDPSGARFRCEATSDCPGGFACIDGYCEGDGGDLVGDQDGAPGGGDAAHDPGDPVAWQEYAVGSRDGSAFTSVVTASDLEGNPGDLYVAFLSTKPRLIDGVASGLGLEWRLVREQCGGRSTAGLMMFWARTTRETRGKVTVDFDVQGFGSALLSVHRFSGARFDAPIGDVSWANSNGSDADDLSCIGGDDSASYSWSTLDTGADESVVVSGAHTTRYTSHDPGDGYTEVGDDQSGDLSSSAGVAVQERLVPDATSGVTVSGGWDNEAPDWAVIAAEIRD